MSEVIENTPKVKKGKTKVGAVIILIISALVFLPAGGAAVYQAIFSHNKAPVFGSYKNKEIRLEQGSDFANAVSQLANQFKSAQMSDEMRQQIFSYAFNQTMMKYAFTDAVEASGWKPSKEAVNRQILPYFYDENGKFSQRIYNSVSDADIASLRKDTEAMMVQNRYVADLFGDTSASFNKTPMYGIKENDVEKAFVQKMASEKHSFQAAAFNTKDFPDSQAVVYGKENAEKFTKYDFSVVTLSEESEAKSVLKQLKDNTLTFEDAVSVKSEKYFTSGSEGKIASPYRYQFASMISSEDDIAKVISLSKDSLSDVVKTTYGYSIFRCDGEPVAADFTKADDVKLVQEYLKANEKGYIENYYIEIASNFISESAISSFDKACKVFGAESVEIPAFPVNYRDSSFYTPTASKSEIAGLSSNVNAYKDIFALELNEVSKPLVLGSNVLVVKCTGIQKDNVEFTDFAEKVSNADNTAANSALFASKNVVNNFFTTYYTMQYANN